EVASDSIRLGGSGVEFTAQELGQALVRGCRFLSPAGEVGAERSGKLARGRSREGGEEPVLGGGADGLLDHRADLPTCGHDSVGDALPQGLDVLVDRGGNVAQAS